MDIPMKDEGNDSDMEDTDNVHIPKVSTTTWFKPIPESYAPNGSEDEDDSFQETLKGYASSSSDDDMVETTPKGSKFWIPEAKNKHVLGTTFDFVEEAFQCYKAYAIEAGFEVKRD
ncbi:hypothetical protein Tco_0863469 [Tanacetum coccineum]